MDRVAEWAGIAGLVVIIGYYALAAALVVRRHRVPAPPVPDSVLSPAAARFIDQGAFDGRTLLAAILSLVAKGSLSLRRRPNGTTYLEPPLDPAGEGTLSEDERLVREALFRTGNRMVDLSDASDNALIDSARLLQSLLELRFVSRPALARWVWIALLLGGAGVAMFALAMPIKFDAYASQTAHSALYLGAFYCVGLAVLWGCYAGARRLRSADSLGRVVVVVVCIALLAPVLIFLGVKIYDHSQENGVLGIAPLALPIVGTWALLRAARARPSPSPRAFAQIADLRQRLLTTENGAAHIGSNKSEAFSDPMLPYRVALTETDVGVANLARVFETIPISSSRVGLFGATSSKPVDLGSIGIMAIR